MRKRTRPARQGYEVWTRVNADGERVYIGVQFEDGRLVAATNAYASGEDARTGMYLRGEQPAWVWANRQHFGHGSL